MDNWFQEATHKPQNSPTEFWSIIAACLNQPGLLKSSIQKQSQEKFQPFINQWSSYGKCKTYHPLWR